MDEGDVEDGADEPDDDDVGGRPPQHRYELIRPLTSGPTRRPHCFYGDG